MSKWKENIKVVLRTIWLGSMDWIHLAEPGTVLHYLSNYLLLNNSLTPWIKLNITDTEYLQICTDNNIILKLILYMIIKLQTI